MSKRPSLKNNSPLSGFITEAVSEDDEVKQSRSQAVKQSKRPRSESIQQETLYLHPEQVFDLEDLVLKMKRRPERVKTSKSAIARAAIDLFLEKDEEEIAAILANY